MSLPIDSIISSSDGTYEIELPEGNYSLFLRDGDKYICDYWQCPTDCYCVYFAIKDGETTVVNANIDHAAW